MSKPDPMAEDELQIKAMKALGFSLVDISSYDKDKWMYVKEIAEYPPHLTNGKSYLQLSRNQATDYLEIINVYTTNKIIEELESLTRIYDGQIKASVMLDLKDRIAALKALNHRKDD